MVIKNKLKISHTEAIYLFAGNTLLHAEQTLEDVYDKYAAQDKFLHLGYCEYATFGDEKAVWIGICDGLYLIVVFIEIPYFILPIMIEL